MLQKTLTAYQFLKNLNKIQQLISVLFLKHNDETIFKSNILGFSFGSFLFNLCKKHNLQFTFYDRYIVG